MITSLDNDRSQLSDTPLVCICIPTYNAASTIHETLESILAQTYINIVIHLSDNASTDETLKVVESFLDPRIIIHRYNENVGGEGNFTRCIQLAEGKYTAIFHADDIYESDMVAKQVAFLDGNADVSAVFTKATIVDDQGVLFGVIGGVPGRRGDVTRLSLKETLKTMLLHHNYLVCPSVMVPTKIYRDKIKVWGNSNLFRSASDVDMWLRFASIKTIAILNQPLMRYRISSMQYSHKNRNRTERADFFLVMDHYLSNPEVCKLLTKDDLRHYVWLERHDRVARAINLIASGRSFEAKDLFNGLFCWDSICAAMHTRRGLVTLTGGILFYLLLISGATSTRYGSVIAKEIKKISWR